MLLSRLGRLCVVLPLVRRFSAVIGPKLDPSFFASHYRVGAGIPFEAKQVLCAVIAIDGVAIRETLRFSR
jgi:hypothetical protein